MGFSSSFICKCKKYRGWIEDGKITTPCPSCGRVYKGMEVIKGGITDIKAVEIKECRQPWSKTNAKTKH